jgi:hypothetical protein
VKIVSTTLELTICAYNASGSGFRLIFLAMDARIFLAGLMPIGVLDGKSGQITSRQTPSTLRSPLMNRILVATFLLTLCSVTVFAADSRGHSPQVVMTNASSAIHAMPNPPAGLKKIFSNLGPKGNEYASGGPVVQGPDNGLNHQENDVAVAFTPKKNSTVTEVLMALQWWGGFNGALAAIYDDAAGSPGKELAGKDLKNFVTFGDGCCKLAKWKLTKGLKVKKGKQYWVVATTDTKSMDSLIVWCSTLNNAAGIFAEQQDDSGWMVFDESGAPATAVFGTIP